MTLGTPTYKPHYALRYNRMTPEDLIEMIQTLGITQEKEREEESEMGGGQIHWEGRERDGMRRREMYYN